MARVQSTSLPTDLQSVKATVDASGHVWCLDGMKLPVNTGLTPAAFVAGAAAFGQPRHVRVPGLACNADLLTRLYGATRAGLFQGLQICSPNACRKADQRGDPRTQLYSIRTCNLAASVGGWRPFTEADLYAYSLRQRYAGGIADADETVTLFEVNSHPVAYFARFVHGLAELALARLVAMVLDPRWFVDETKPDKATKLPQFLGLTPQSQAPGAPRQPERYERYQTVLACWKNAQPDLLAPFPPGSFLWRTWYARGGGDAGDLAACKQFVSFLRQVWVAAVAGSAPFGTLFVPEYFFTHADDVAEFKHHLAQRAAPA